MANEWTARFLGDLCKLRAGCAFPKKYQGRERGDYPFVKVSDMNSSANMIHIVEANNWITDTEREKLRISPHPKGAVVFAKIGVALTYNRR